MLTRGLSSSTEPPWYKTRGVSGRVKIKKELGIRIGRVWTSVSGLKSAHTAQIDFYY